MTIAELITTYGYAAILIGTFFEGETILILGGLAAHQGYLELPWVILSGFIGTVLGDQLFFYIGRFKGQSILNNKPHWKSRSARVFSLLRRHKITLIISFRFMYGMRTITPIMIGVSGVAPAFYLVFNFIGAMLWATVIGFLGYLFGQALESLIGNIKQYELIVFIVLFSGGALIWGIRYITNKRN
jgi:membrane protein DedA with SNARE-associated domain